LRGLTLADCKNTNDSSVQELVDRSPRLTMLDIRGCTLVSKELNEIIRKQRPLLSIYSSGANLRTTTEMSPFTDFEGNEPNGDVQD